MMGLMSLQILVVGEFRGGLLTQGGIFLVFVLGGVLLSLFCIVSFIAISRAAVNHDDGAGTVLDPLVWSAGSAPKRRRVAVRNRAFFTWTA